MTNFGERKLRACDWEEHVTCECDLNSEICFVEQFLCHLSLDF
jgi:hypothetical protein